MLTSMRRSSTCMVENVVKPVGAEIHRRAGAIPISPGPSVSWPPSTATRRRWASACTGCWRPRGARRWPRCAARPTRPATRQPTTASPRPDRSAMPVSPTPCALSRGSSNPMASDTCPALGAGHARAYPPGGQGPRALPQRAGAQVRLHSDHELGPDRDRATAQVDALEASSQRVRHGLRRATVRRSPIDQQQSAARRVDSPVARPGAGDCRTRSHSRRRRDRPRR